MSRLSAFAQLAPPLVFGHRGLNTVAEENTLGAISAAADQGADGVEIDVRPCGSGELVLAHDPTLKRVSAGRDQRAVATLSLDELSALASTDPSLAIPSLADVLSLCRQRDLALNVEMKRDVPSRPAAVRSVARELADYGRHCALIVSSFDPWMLSAFRVLRPRIPTALLLHRDGQRYRLSHATRVLGVAAVHVERTFVQRRWVRRWHAQGLRVLVWTVNHPQEVRDLLALGVDGFISDDPRMVCHVLEMMRCRAQ